ncbi:MAG: ROK family protein [Candidatus Gribaldobacteria bacterium]|nr:ROK family protein [Candidatus Gribaldobacteria bacterium]
MQKIEVGAAIGIDIGAIGTKLAIVSRGSCRLFDSTYVPKIENEIPEHYIGRLVSAIKMLKSYYKIASDDKELLGVGLGIPSWNGEKKMVANSPNMEFLNDFPLVEALEEVFPQWEEKIVADNDANVAGDAEVMFGGWEGSERGINVFTLGGGVGFGGYLYDPTSDKLIKVTGAHYRGGEGGHIPIPHPPGAPKRKCNCGYDDCLEAYASATAVMNFAQMAITPQTGSLIDVMVAQDPVYDRSKRRGDQVTPLHIEKAAKIGDNRALEIQGWLAFALAHGMRAMNQIFDPGLFIICGGMSRWTAAIRQARTILHSLPGVVPNKGVRVCSSRLKNAGILGAAALVLSENDNVGDEHQIGKDPI